MKLKSIVGLFCLFVAAITVTSCEKDKAVLASGSCTFTFDGTAYSANTASGYLEDTVGIGKKALTVQAMVGNLKTFLAATIIFPDTLVTGEFTEANNAFIMFSQDVSNSNDTSWTSTTTTIKITSINSKYAEGTFFGNLKRGETVKPITDGKFKVNISTEN
ncbi:hypothetical protein SAMN05518672_1011437 [Chitinophaga sp. CF118]|uniref:hypothetical protein n=1 Tax=Chitinophaga sp. CF118 TaxID=1884367 RepID=UPI0008F2F592|nr:hypothetical protein [Chitinophaga sp. CF118]SFD28381.1 hypothetical protein SAMN05518672_1011437 [Chitinophaga sp. CF118]